MACCDVIKDVVSNETLYLQDLEMHQCLVCRLPVQSGEVCMVHILIFLFHSCYKGTKKRTLCIRSSFFRPGKLNQFMGFQKLIKLWYKLCNQPWPGCHLSWGVFRLTFWVTRMLSIEFFLNCIVRRKIYLEQLVKMKLYHLLKFKWSFLNKSDF